MKLSRISVLLLFLCPLALADDEVIKSIPVELKPGAIDKAVRGPTETENEAYERFEECLERLHIDFPGDYARGHYGYFSLKDVHQGVTNRANACVEHLPKEAGSDAKRYIETMTEFTKPKPLRGIERGDLKVRSGLVFQTGSGRSALLEGDVSLNHPRAKVFKLREGYETRLRVKALAGATGEGHGLVPKLKVELEGGKPIDLYMDKNDKKSLISLAGIEDEVGANVSAEKCEKADATKQNCDKSKDEESDEVGLLAAFTGLNVGPAVRVTFDRDTAMSRQWDAFVGAGMKGGIIGKYKGYPVMLAPRAYLDVGVAKIDGSTKPYLRIELGGKGYLCKVVSKNKKHLVCANADLSARLGFVQAGVDLDLGASYRYKVSDDRSKWLHHIDVGTNVSGSLQADHGGGHGAANTMLFGVKIQ